MASGPIKQENGDAPSCDANSPDIIIKRETTQTPNPPAPSSDAANSGNTFLGTADGRLTTTTAPLSCSTGTLPEQEHKHNGLGTSYSSPNPASPLPVQTPQLQQPPLHPQAPTTTSLAIPQAPTSATPHHLLATQHAVHVNSNRSQREDSLEPSTSEAASIARRLLPLLPTGKFLVVLHNLPGDDAYRYRLRPAIHDELARLRPPREVFWLLMPVEYDWIARSDPDVLAMYPGPRTMI